MQMDPQMLAYTSQRLAAQEKQLLTQEMVNAWFSYDQLKRRLDFTEAGGRGRKTEG